MENKHEKPTKKKLDSMAIAGRGSGMENDWKEGYNQCHEDFTSYLKESKNDDNGWISVEEMLPEEEFGNKGISYLESKEVLVWDGDSQYLSCYDYDNMTWDNEDILDDVTHWMPLPDKPKTKVKDTNK